MVDQLHQRETLLGVRQVFMAGPDDEQVEATTFLRRPVTHNGGAVTHNGGPCREDPPFHLPPPASLPAAVRLNDPHIVPSGVHNPQTAVFSRETRSVTSSALKSGEISGTRCLELEQTIFIS